MLLLRLPVVHSRADLYVIRDAEELANIKISVSLGLGSSCFNKWFKKCCVHVDMWECRVWWKTLQKTCKQLVSPNYWLVNMKRGNFLSFIGLCTDTKIFQRNIFNPLNVAEPDKVTKNVWFGNFVI